MNEITRVLAAIGGGAASADDLLPLVYAELRALARAKMAREKPGHTLQPTALVHEAWLRLGGEWERVPVESVEIALPLPAEELLALDEALARLAQHDPPAAQLVKLCFFAGLTQAQAARELGLPLRTAERTWRYARAWLFCEIKKATDADGAAG